MLPLDNVTTIYLTGLVSLSFAAIQLNLFRKKGKAVVFWSMGAVLSGLGYIISLNQASQPVEISWLIGPIFILLGGLLSLGALGYWSGYVLPKKASLICLGGVVLTAVIFHFGRIFDAPLGSLAVILLGPFAALLIYSAWFSGAQAYSTQRKNLYVISSFLWVQGIFIALLTLGSLAGMVDQYLAITSKLFYWGGLIYFVTTLGINLSWSFLIAEDLFNSININQPVNKLASNKLKSANQDSNINNDDAVEVVKKVTTKSKPVAMINVNLDLLTDKEKTTMINSLTDREREVFYLVTEGKRNGEMATILNSSEASIKVHRSRMTSKLGLKKPEDLKKLIVSVPSDKLTLSEVTEKLQNEQAPDLFT
jgi:DNA-binding CsgD family transcriptional regulator